MLEQVQREDSRVLFPFSVESPQQRINNNMGQYDEDGRDSRGGSSVRRPDTAVMMERGAVRTLDQLSKRLGKVRCHIF